MSSNRTRTIAVALAMALWLAVGASGALAADTLPLHTGSSGPRVAALQWLLSGHAPNAFTKVHPTMKMPARGSSSRGFFGPGTRRALSAYKYRLGYPVGHWNDGRAGKEFFGLVTGKTHWTKAYAATAARRLRGSVAPGVSPMALKIKTLEVSQLTPAGQTAETWGRNYGPMVRQYQLVTGALRQAWCVSFQQWSTLNAGWGTFAGKTAGVFAAVDWAAARSYLHAKAKVGALVAFDAIHRKRGGGHIGFVSKVLASGIVSLEGNSRNAVRENFHPFGSREMVYIWLPGIA